MDVTKPFPKLVKIQEPTGRVFEQPIAYEWKLIFCQKCLQVGHSCQEKATATITMPGMRKRQNQSLRKEWKPTGIPPTKNAITQQNKNLADKDKGVVIDESTEEEWQTVKYKSRK